MTKKVTLTTERLILRPWREEDFKPFAAMNANPEVMRYFPALQDADKTRELMGKVEAHHQKHGFTFFAAEVPGVAPFIGFVGLARVLDEAYPFAPAVEIGWRLAPEFWHKGYATEGALECLRFAFEDLKLDEVVALTAAQNEPSQAVMERIGMTYDPTADFEHPMITEGSPVRNHILYRIQRAEFKDRDHG